MGACRLYFIKISHNCACLGVNRKKNDLQKRVIFVVVVPVIVDVGGH